VILALAAHVLDFCTLSELSLVMPSCHMVLAGFAALCFSLIVASSAEFKPDELKPDEHKPDGKMFESYIGGAGYNGGFSVDSPDPSLLVWDKVSPHASPQQKLWKAGWMKVKVENDPYLAHYEMSPQACLRVLMKPASKQPARLGPILLHCGGPGTDANCATFMGHEFFEISSPYLVGAPLSDDYDYWSISQRGMNQRLYAFPQTTCPFKDENKNALPSWPAVQCPYISPTPDLLQRLGVDKEDKETLKMLGDIMQGPDIQTFGFPYYNETYVRWAYRLNALLQNLCFHSEQFQLRSPTTNRSYNTLEHTSTSDLARDIEMFRRAIGAKKMSIYGISYGTKVASVYATDYPDKTHRLIFDGDMGTDPDVAVFAKWVGQSTEAVWAGLAMACDNSVMVGGEPESICPAGPFVTAKVNKILCACDSIEEKKKAAALYAALSGTIYYPGVPDAAQMMKCIADLHKGHASFPCSNSNGRYPPMVGQFAAIGAVLGLDLAGRFTEDAYIQWWRTTKEEQPLGITRSLDFVMSVGAWPAIPRPQAPAGNSFLAPLVIGNLHDGQTPYHNAQNMIEQFPSGRMLTSQFYGHGSQLPHDVDAVVKRYEDEMRRGAVPTYDDETAKLICVRVALLYLKNGTLPTHDYVCKVAGPVQTGPGKVAMAHAPTQQNEILM